VNRPRFLPKVLLLQVRRSIEAIRHERECFERVCDGQAELDFHNLMQDPEISWPDVQPYEVLLLGGSGECTATEEYEFTGPLEDVLTRWVDDSRPFFGSCWGHHFLAAMLGGEVRTDESKEEVGTFSVQLTPAGRKDPLFSSLPASFQAQMGHHDSVIQLPPGTESLAWSERCPNQAMTVVGKPIYSTQFHSEMGRRDIVHRLRMYRESYLEGETMESVERTLKPSPAVKPLVSRFLQLVT
jgi:GMP synthase (glutamine-hydrolysing)